MKQTDILLVNSFAPRQRILSDVGLENGLAIIRTHLEEKGFVVHVIDELRLGSVEQGVPRWCVNLLRLLAKLHLKAYQNGAKIVNLLLFLVSKHVQAFSLLCRKRYMDREIERIAGCVKSGQIPVVGIKSGYGEAFKWVLRLTARIKEVCPETVVIVGGPQVKVYGAEVLHWKEFDLAIMGPGEEMLEQLLLIRREAGDKQAFLQKVLADFPGAPFLRTGGYREKCSVTTYSDVEKYVIPRYKDTDIKDKLLFHTLIDGSGCVWSKCNFCAHTRHSMPYQPRSVEEIVGEMKALTQLGVAFFRFGSSETPIAHGQKIAQTILDEGLKVNYSMYKRPGKVTTATYAAFRMMIKSGLRAVFMGGETGHDLINDKIMNKGTSKKDVIDTIHCIRLAAAEVGESCRVGLSLIYPCPVVEGVTLQDIYAENFSLIDQTKPDAVVVNPPALFPATNWYEETKKYGFKVSEDFMRTMMQYEYSIYKPAEAWDKLDYALDELSFVEILRETGRLRKAVMDMGIPTDVSDEFLMMLDAIGFKSSVDMIKFKQQSLLDIMTGSATYGNEIVRQINEKSRSIARLNIIG